LHVAETHCRSVVLVGATAWYVLLATQVVQAVHEAAFVVLENEPLAQGVHVRFDVGVPAALTEVPAGHTVDGVQASAFVVSV
jgi:hypothetical protein